MIRGYICQSTNKMYRVQRMMSDISALTLEGTDADELNELYLKCMSIMNKSKGGDQATRKQATDYSEGQLIDVLKASGDPILRWATEIQREVGGIRTRSIGNKTKRTMSRMANQKG